MGARPVLVLLAAHLLATHARAQIPAPARTLAAQPDPLARIRAARAEIARRLDAAPDGDAPEPEEQCLQDALARADVALRAAELQAARSMEGPEDAATTLHRSKVLTLLAERAGEASRRAAECALEPRDAAVSPAPASRPVVPSLVRLDVQGDAHYSHFGFTDQVKPYASVDGWMEAKGTLWLHPRHAIGTYASLLPSFSSSPSFWWQRYLQLGWGLQVFPLRFSSAGDRSVLEALRLFTFGAGRLHFDVPDGAAREPADLEAGADYYADTLLSPTPVGFALWTKAAFHATAFSLPDYLAVLWQGAARAGPKLPLGRAGLLFPRALTDWSLVSGHPDRWWEHFVRIGAGLAYYPFAARERGLPRHLRRAHLYVELVHQPRFRSPNRPPPQVEPTDLRTGLSLATEGFFAEE